MSNREIHMSYQKQLIVICVSLAALILAACQPLAPLPPAATQAPAAAEVSATGGVSASVGAAGGLRPIPVSNATIEVGTGSPIPVDAFISGEWPDLCAQLAEIRQSVKGNTIEITLLATAPDPACPPDFLGLPFRIAIPINVVEMPEGDYTVSANGVSTTFSVPVASAQLGRRPDNGSR
jgi:hypothetical protein